MRAINAEKTQYLSQLSGVNPSREKKSANFDEILNKALDEAEGESKILSDVERFKNDLAKLGAYGYLAQLNADKIEQKVAEKRKELSELLGLNDPNKSAEEKSELNQTLNEFLNKYRKELNGALNNTILQRQQNLDGVVSSNVNLNSVLAELSLL
ncbi:response regulator [uncultured Campylobacter sp.]|jgi:response regulator|uniref:response regulator n=1 Tax=uncultured Campylobacter sp. TaxID=218934 RepID=UPI0025CB8376|nr:response regulator [uncultured Campylobacter sp.]